MVKPLEPSAPVKRVRSLKIAAKSWKIRTKKEGYFDVFPPLLCKGEQEVPLCLLVFPAPAILRVILDEEWIKLGVLIV